MLSTSMCRVLRPLAGESLQSRSSFSLPSDGLALIAGPQSVASEDVAKELASQGALDATVWLRLDALDSDPRCLLESLLRAARHAGHEVLEDVAIGDDAPDALSHEQVGRRLAQVLSTARVLVVEDDLATDHSAQAVRTLAAWLRDLEPGARAIYLCHGSLRRRIKRIADHVLKDMGIVESVAALMQGENGCHAEDLARLVPLVKDDRAILYDIIDAARLRDHELLSHLNVRKFRYRSLLERINDRILPTVTPAELLALSTATKTGYWHRDLSDPAPPPEITLRPWMVALEEGWWWIRPMWRRPLAQSLDHAHRAGRRFFADYHPVAAEPQPPPGGETPVEASGDTVTTRRAATPSESDSEEEARPPTANSVRSSSRAPEHQIVPLRARMFGVFELEIEDQMVPTWHGHLGRSIIAYLLFQPDHCVTRDRLLDVFWPEADPKPARNRLRVAISSLRRSLKAASSSQVIEFLDGNYRLARNCRVEIDVTRFEHRAKAGRRHEASARPDDAVRAYQEALDCYRGEFLSEMPYDEWTVLPREALRVAYLECLGTAASLRLGRGEYSEALRLAWEILGTDSASEDAHRLIMRCHAERGEIHQARRQFDLCCHELTTVLGVEPTTATVALAQSLEQ